MLTSINVRVSRLEALDNGQTRVWVRPVTPEGNLGWPEYPPFDMQTAEAPQLLADLVITIDHAPQP